MNNKSNGGRRGVRQPELSREMEGRGGRIREMGVFWFAEGVEGGSRGLGSVKA